ncbi:MAG: SOS response-associated peptidase [Alphaproteobacteria bacterium]|nr:SOS response-associated peptidase [Alphaproteobacteria bacterium]
MCGRYTLTTTIAQLAAAFDLANLPNLPARANIAPTQEVAAVRLEEGVRRLALLRWGLIPSFAKDTRLAASMINARAETVAEKPSFRTAFRRRRCLILADGFYEWRVEGKNKQPYRITLASGAPLAFAGLWEMWTPSNGETVVSCTIVTCAANEVLVSLHDRMPVILPPEAVGAWLDPKSQPEDLQGLLRPYPAKEMTYYPVSTRVNSVRNDDAGCIAPLASTRLL